MTLKSHISSRGCGFYSRLARACIALLLLGFSLLGLILQVVPASALSIDGTKYQNGQGPCKKICQTETATASVTATQPIIVTVTKTVTATRTATPTPTTGITPGLTVTPTVTPTPTNSSTPVTPGSPTSNTPVPGQTPPQTTGNGTLPGGGGNNGNTPGGGSIGGLFTTAALILGVLAFLLYLVPQRGTSLSILNKILSLILPVSFLRRMDE